MHLTHLSLLDTLGFRGLDIAESLDYRAVRFFRCHSATDELVEAHFRVEAELVIDVLCDIGAPETEVSAPSGRLGHAGVGGASSAANTALAKRVQVAVSTRSCARPFGVRR